MDEYVRKPSVFKAIQLSVENINDVIDEYEVATFGIDREKPELSWIHIDLGWEHRLVCIGDWIVKDPIGEIRVYTDEQFHMLFMRRQ